MALSGFDLVKTFKVLRNRATVQILVLAAVPTLIAPAWTHLRGNRYKNLMFYGISLKNTGSDPSSNCFRAVWADKTKNEWISESFDFNPLLGPDFEFCSYFTSIEQQLLLLPFTNTDVSCTFRIVCEFVSRANIQSERRLQRNNSEDIGFCCNGEIMSL